MFHSLSSNDLSLFSYEILGLVGREGAAPHDLLRLARRDRMLAWAGESQYYVEPKRLAKLGYLEARKEPGATRERTVYSLTHRGQEALEEWARTPARFTPLKSEAMVRLLVADLVGERATRASLAALREDIADLEARLEDTAAGTRALPHRSKYLELATDFRRKLLALHLGLVDAVERELEP
jgi:DNA-binding PadR family transcriptional regulator